MRLSIKQLLIGLNLIGILVKCLDEYRVLQYIASLLSSTQNDDQEASGIYKHIVICSMF